MVSDNKMGFVPVNSFTQPMYHSINSPNVSPQAPEKKIENIIFFLNNPNPYPLPIHFWEF